MTWYDAKQHDMMWPGDIDMNLLLKIETPPPYQ